MEMYDQITDHEERALDRQVWQYSGKTNFDNLISIHAERMQKLENVLYDLLLNRAISNAEGVQLDLAGEFLQIDRDGLSGADYRARLLSAGNEKRKAGQVEILLSTLRSLTENENVSLIQSFPATVLMHIIADEFTDIDSQNSIKVAMESIVAAGVNLFIGTQLESSVFKFSDNIAGGAAGEGFATTIDGADGGVFARLIGLEQSYKILSEDSFILLSEDGFAIISDTGTA